MPIVFHFPRSWYMRPTLPPVVILPWFHMNCHAIWSVPPLHVRISFRFITNSFTSFSFVCAYVDRFAYWPMAAAVYVIPLLCAGSIFSWEDFLLLQWTFLIGIMTSSVTFPMGFFCIPYAAMAVYKRFYDFVYANSPFLFWRVHRFTRDALTEF